MTPGRIGDLPQALEDESLLRRLAGRRPAIFLDYDGTLTPIVDRPADAVLSVPMRNAVRELAARCPVCVVSGRDRPVVQRLMGLDDLIVAGSHGFDIWSPGGGAVQREEAIAHRELIEAVSAAARDRIANISGASVEPKRASVAVHYRMVPGPRRDAVRGVVDSLLADHPGRLRVTPGKMVYEIQPDVAWDKGRAVLHLLAALDLDGDDVVPVYIGDDITDEDAFEALRDRGVGIVVRGAEPDREDRATAATLALDEVADVERLLGMLAARITAGRMSAS